MGVLQSQWKADHVVGLVHILSTPGWLYVNDPFKQQSALQPERLNQTTRKITTGRGVAITVLSPGSGSV